MLKTIPANINPSLEYSALKLKWETGITIYYLEHEIPRHRDDSFHVGVSKTPSDYLHLLHDNTLDMLLSLDELKDDYTLHNIHKAHYRYAEIIRQHIAHLEMQKRVDQLRADMKQGLTVVAHLLSLRHKELGEHSVRVANTSRIFARLLGLQYEDELSVYQAGLLHDIGLISLPDQAFKTDIKHMPQDLQKQWDKHADLGAQIMMGFPWLFKASELVRAHHERYDGKGKPDGLAGNQIPKGAMIINIVNDYDDWQSGHFDGIHRNPREALVEMVKFRGIRYDPTLFDFFLNHVVPAMAREQVYEEELTTDKLKPDMILSRDVYTYDGVLLLAGGRRINIIDIQALRIFEERKNFKLSIWVKNQ